MFALLQICLFFCHHLTEACRLTEEKNIQSMIYVHAIVVDHPQYSSGLGLGWRAPGYEKHISGQMGQIYYLVPSSVFYADHTLYLHKLVVKKVLRE